MNGGEQRVKDILALIGWGVLAMWGWITATGADSMRTDPGMIRGDEKATILEVSGALLLVLALVLGLGAVIRLAIGRDRLAPPQVSVVLGWALVALFVVFFVGGARLTRGQGVAAMAAAVLPYLIAGVAVLFARRPVAPSTVRPWRR